jgi:hypothetical protein
MFVIMNRYSADLTNLQEYDIMSQGVGIHPKGKIVCCHGNIIILNIFYLPVYKDGFVILCSNRYLFLKLNHQLGVGP